MSRAVTPRSKGRPSYRPAKPATATYDMSHFLLTMLWSADPELARRADEAGVDRIGLDLEVLGKAERQKGLSTWVSQHRADQLTALRRAVTKGELFCRVNPIHDGSKAEIDRLLSYGVDVLMLPMFTTVREPQTFIDLVAGRAKAVLLLEHRLAADHVEEIARIKGIDNIHIGLTDLSLSLGVKNRFGLLASDLVNRIAAAVHGQGLRLCIGGIGRALDDSQPIPTDLIYAQYARLRATGALISRAFFGTDPASMDVQGEIDKARWRLEWWRTRSPAELEDAKTRFLEKVAACQTW